MREGGPLDRTMGWHRQLESLLGEVLLQADVTASLADDDPAVGRRADVTQRVRLSPSSESRLDTLASWSRISRRRPSQGWSIRVNLASAEAGR